MARVLVVDDDPGTLDVLELSISLGGYEAICARNGLEALELARAHRPDLIILDNMMPGMDGLETTRRLREDPALSHIPIIMATARTLDEDAWQGWQAGVDSYLTKPLDLTLLHAEMSRLGFPSELGGAA